MYDLPFIPSTNRHNVVMKKILSLIERLHGGDDEGAFVAVDFVEEMISSKKFCLDFWEELRKDALESGLEADDPALQLRD